MSAGKGGELQLEGAEEALSPRKGPQCDQQRQLMATSARGWRGSLPLAKSPAPQDPLQDTIPPPTTTLGPRDGTTGVSQDVQELSPSH